MMSSESFSLRKNENPHMKINGKTGREQNNSLQMKL